ncbi:flagellar hook-associated protein 2 [Sutcliffiella horikoshii]|uniref:flagellar hook-associated protein 2 n=1 Tax=Sutcliffiella horikoshii TaxID=79883 RepID=UPI001F241E84|nr:flagellar hook-associated protein 2 [Sutcliffiella horikoshii]MCG1021589.1 flagellar hook-associated protein 2 [Sutcliffiella horikoshii]
MRLTGFQSGLDINQMVSDLMKAQRMPMNKLSQQKQLLEWKRDAYRETNRLLNDFRNLSFDMTLQRSYSQKQVTSSNSAVSALASSSAANANYTISDVKAATAAYRSSTNLLEEDSSFDPNKSLWEQRDKFQNFALTQQTQDAIVLKGETNSMQLKGSVEWNEEMNIWVGADKIPVYTKSNIPENINGNFATLDEKTGKLTFNEPLAAGSEVQAFEYDSFSFDFSITTFNQQGAKVEQEFKFDGSATMNEVMNRISSSNVGVTAFFDEVKGTIMMTRKDAGTFRSADASHEIQVTGAFMTNVMKLDNKNIEQGGTAATFKINGVATERNSNSFTLNGVTFTLNGDMEGESVISIKNDTDKTFQAIKDYITKYNELIGKINGKLGEPLHRDYKPLSNEERESLSEKQIEQWEEKAMSGLLRNDSILSSGLGQMRMSFYEPISGISGAFNQLSQIGISTGANYLDKGKLIIDEDKLREAIEKDSSSVMELFTANGADRSSQGLARKLRENVTATIQSIEARAGTPTRTAQQFTMGRELLNVDQRISAFERRMQTVEARYWKQFTAMEKAIGQSNQQSMQLMSQFFNG